MNKLLTVDLLESKKACSAQIKLFKQHFPNGAAFSLESTISVASIFDWDWAASNLLSFEGLKTYKEGKASLLKTYEEGKAPLWKTYKEGTAPLWNTYEEGTAPLWKTYKEGTAPLWKTYKEGAASLWNTYEEGKASLWNTYKEGTASLFAAIYIRENTV